MRILFFAFGLFTLGLLSSCEREVHLTLSTGAPKLVVDGQINDGYPPFVILTNTIGFFANVDFSTIQNSFVHGATIKVSDGTNTITLKEYSLDTANHSKFYVYTIDTADLTSRGFLGQIGKFYTLTINYNNQTYTSTTKIPEPVHIDSLGVMAVPFPPAKYPDAVELVVYFKDPDTLGNYARYYTKRNSEPYYSGDIYSDEVTNGVPVNWHIRPGYNTLQPDSTTSNFFFKGDTVSVAWSSIDKGVYTFWNTFAFAVSAAGDPFSSPINAKSNISNGALGVWGGYGSSTATIIIPK